MVLKEWLSSIGVAYSFAGGALGGRPKDALLYANGRADYLRMAQSEDFRKGLRRVATGARSHRIALLCAEADPLECHRFLLVGRALHEGGLEVQHILPSGAAEAHTATEERLLRVAGLLQSGFFEDISNALARAYVLQASRVAYTPRVVDVDTSEPPGE